MPSATLHKKSCVWQKSASECLFDKGGGSGGGWGGQQLFGQCPHRRVTFEKGACLTPIPIQFMGVNAMWAVVHWIIWDGKVSNSQDIVASVLSPGEYLENDCSKH